MHDFILLEGTKTPFKIDFSSLKKMQYYKKISISDEFIVKNYKYFSEPYADFSAFWITMDNPRNGLCYYGVSIIVLSEDCNFIHTLKKIEKSDEKKELIELCNIALLNNLNIVHFGI